MTKAKSVYRRLTGVVVALALLLLFGVIGCGGQQDGERQDEGSTLFAENCSACHGTDADGTDSGPPLVHKIYEPGHHPDFAFQNAVKNGVISHHWDFGDMSPVAGLSEDEVARIITHIRELQREGGIIN